MSLINNSNLTPATLYGKGDNGNVSMQVSPTGIILGGDLNTASPITATISQAGIITDNPTGFDILSSLNMNQNIVSNVSQLALKDTDGVTTSSITQGTTGDLTINATSNQLVLSSNDNITMYPGVGLLVQASDYVSLNAQTASTTIDKINGVNITTTDGQDINISSDGNMTLGATNGTMNLNSSPGQLFINGNQPLTAIPTLEQVLTAGNSGTSGQTMSLNTAGAITTYGGYTIDCDSDFVIGSSGGDTTSLRIAGNFLNFFRNNTIDPNGYIYTFGGTQVNFNPTGIVVSNGTTLNTIDQNGYTTRNTNANATHYLTFVDATSTGVGAIQKSAGIECNPNTNTITADIFVGTLQGVSNSSNNSNIIEANFNSDYTILCSTGNSGTLPIYGSGVDLNYNPVSQTLSVKNMIVSGNETQTGIITTNVLKTDIMYQQVSYTNTAVVNIPTTTALLSYGTFFMSTYDTGSTLANSIVQYIFPTLPTDGSMDGYTFQIRKLRGGVNQTTQNWIFTALGNYILPNGNTLNTGSGGAVNNTSPNSFTQRFTIATYSNVGYYVGCNN